MNGGVPATAAVPAATAIAAPPEPAAPPAVPDLPGWLVRPQAYEPCRDRTGFMAKNMLRLTSMLRNVRMGGGSSAILFGAGPSSPLDRALARVAPALRLAGLLLAVLLVLMSHSSTFLMVAACIDLVLVALRPVDGIRATLLPAFAAAIVAAVLAVPAAFLSGAAGTASMLFIAAKTLVNVSLVLGLSWSVPWNRLIGALKAYRAPDEIIFTLDTALKHIEILGRAAASLNESLMLRSVGRTRGRYEKTTSSAGVMGATFLRSVACARAMDEAMTCRGFTGGYLRRREKVLTPAGAAYLVALALLVAVYLMVG